MHFHCTGFHCWCFSLYLAFKTDAENKLNRIQNYWQLYNQKSKSNKFSISLQLVNWVLASLAGVKVVHVSSYIDCVNPYGRWHPVAQKFPIKEQFTPFKTFLIWLSQNRKWETELAFSFPQKPTNCIEIGNYSSTVFNLKNASQKNPSIWLVTTIYVRPCSNIILQSVSTGYHLCLLVTVSSSRHTYPTDHHIIIQHTIHI